MFTGEQINQFIKEKDGSNRLVWFDCSEDDIPDILRYLNIHDSQAVVIGIPLDAGGPRVMGIILEHLSLLPEGTDIIEADYEHLLEEAFDKVDLYSGDIDFTNIYMILSTDSRSTGQTVRSSLSALRLASSVMLPYRKVAVFDCIVNRPALEEEIDHIVASEKEHRDKDSDELSASDALDTLYAEYRRSLDPLPCLTILGHPDLERIGDRVFLGELVTGRQAFLSRREPRFMAPGAGAVIGGPLADRYLSRRPLLFEPLASGGIRLSKNDSRTVVKVAGREVGEVAEITAAELHDGVVLELAGRIVLLLHLLERPPTEPPPRFGLVGDSAGIVKVREAIARAGPFDVSVLLRGETGTGKELVARGLHQASPRQGEFVGVNLGALTLSLASAELFGHRKGAFTGADDHRPGYFVQAEGGTLFLDEIGEAPTEVQVMLLRALENAEIHPVGSQVAHPVDVRVVSATDADLDALVADKGFRAPLRHRLSGYTIHLPPLCHRRDDIGRLFIHFLRREREDAGLGPPPQDRKPWLPAALVARLASYHWPGNVRQLLNVTRQLVIDNRGRATLDAVTDVDLLLSG